MTPDNDGNIKITHSYLDALHAELHEITRILRKIEQVLDRFSPQIGTGPPPLAGWAVRRAAKNGRQADGQH